MIKTVGASVVLKYNDQYLFEIQKRHKWHHNLGKELLICIGCIGGAIEEGESPSEALMREVKEEIGTEIKILEWKQPFAIDSNREVTDESKLEENIFFDWYGAREPYRNSRICVFLGEVIGAPFPGDLPGLLVTDIQLLLECVKKHPRSNSVSTKG